MRSDSTPAGLTPATSESAVRAFGLALGLSLVALAVLPYGNTSSAGTLDPWIYTGYFFDLPGLTARFPGDYYGTRLPYIIPGYALYKVFTPGVANLLLNALILSSILAPLYLICRRWFSVGTAWLAMASAAGNAYLASTYVWDYPDGPAIAFGMLAVWLGVAPPRSVTPHLALALAGACGVMAFLSNFIAIFVLGPTLLTALLWRDAKRKGLLLELLSVALGALVCFGLWCAVSKAILGYYNILGPQLAQLRYAADHPDYLLNMWGRGYEWISSAWRLLPFTVLAIAGVLPLLDAPTRASEQGRGLRAAWVGFLVALGLVAWMEFGAHKVLLRVFYHSSYLLLPFLLTQGALIGVWLRQLAASRRATGVLAIVTVIALLLPTLLRGWHFPSRTEPLIPWLWGSAILTLTGAAVAVRRPRIGTWLALPALGFLTSASMVADVTVYSMTLRPKEKVFSQSHQGGQANDGRENLILAADLMTLLRNAGIRDNPIRFWYDKDEPSLPLFDSLFSMFHWGYLDFSRLLPTQTSVEAQSSFPPGTRVLHLVSDPSRVAARRALLEARGLRWRQLGSWNLGRHGTACRLVLDEVSLP